MPEYSVNLQGGMSFERFGPGSCGLQVDLSFCVRAGLLDPRNEPKGNSWLETERKQRSNTILCLGAGEAGKELLIPLNHLLLEQEAIHWAMHDQFFRMRVPSRELEELLVFTSQLPEVILVDIEPQKFEDEVRQKASQLIDSSSAPPDIRAGYHRWLREKVSWRQLDVTKFDELSTLIKDYDPRDVTIFNLLTRFPFEIQDAIITTVYRNLNFGAVLTISEPDFTNSQLVEPGDLSELHKMAVKDVDSLFWQAPFGQSFNDFVPFIPTSEDQGMHELTVEPEGWGQIYYLRSYIRALERLLQLGVIPFHLSYDNIWPTHYTFRCAKGRFKEALLAREYFYDKCLISVDFRELLQFRREAPFKEKIDLDKVLKILSKISPQFLKIYTITGETFEDLARFYKSIADLDIENNGLPGVV